MKRNIKMAALMIAAAATMVACNNNAATEEALDTIPAEVAEEIVVEEPCVESEDVAVAEEKATTDVVAFDNTKKQTTIDASSKPSASEFEGELKKGTDGSVKQHSLSKPKAADMVNNLKKVE